MAVVRAHEPDALGSGETYEKQGNKEVRKTNQGDPWMRGTCTQRVVQEARASASAVEIGCDQVAGESEMEQKSQDDQRGRRPQCARASGQVVGERPPRADTLSFQRNHWCSRRSRLDC